MGRVEDKLMPLGTMVKMESGRWRDGERKMESLENVQGVGRSRIEWMALDAMVKMECGRWWAVDREP